MLSSPICICITLNRYTFCSKEQIVAPRGKTKHYFQLLVNCCDFIVDCVMHTVYLAARKVGFTLLLSHASMRLCAESPLQAGTVISRSRLLMVSQWEAGSQSCDCCESHVWSHDRKKHVAL